MKNIKFGKFAVIFSSTFLFFVLIHGKVEKGQTSNCPARQISSNTVEDIVTLPNNKRGNIYLNGVWKFRPAVGSVQDKIPEEGWGEILVPGDWRQENNESVPGVIQRGTGSAWDNFDGKQLSKAWYKQRVTIPKDWENRTILIDLKRVSTDALVYVNGIQCGEVNWPYGAVDISNLVKPGTTAEIALLVAAAGDDSEKAVIMGPNEIYTTKTKLASRGLIGEVRLLSLPTKAHISDVFVQPSIRQKNIKLDIELSEINQKGPVEIIAKMLNEKGEIEREFKATTNAKATPSQVLQVVWDWEKPRLWDVGKPNLYTLRLQVKGSGIDDEYDQTFGFREFWIEGRNFYLNGTEIRFRPVLYEDKWAIGMPEVANRVIDSYFWAGFNIAELWPWNHDERGKWHFRELFADCADRKGFPLMGPALDMGNLAYSGKWKNEQERKKWEEKMVTELRRYRNHPSILLWANSPNFFGLNDDQNPRRIGKKQVEGTLGEREDKRFQALFPMGEKVVATIKKYDPTRPVLMHQGAVVGDVYALNSYLNMIPLQEREEWLSQWVQSGNMPYMVVEFGTPMHATMMRSRDGFKNAVISEPLMTEFAAIYLGKEAYQLETPAYRSKIRELFVKDQEYKSWHFNPNLDFAPAFQKLEQLFITNTWRSWRTFGITGGMIPWNDGQGWQVSDAGKEKIPMGPLQAGQRGVFLPTVPKSLWYNYQIEGNTIHPAGLALLENNGPTLAWIAGGNGAIAEKNHNYRAGDSLQKQVVLLNDTRDKQDFAFNWEVKINGETLATGDKTGVIEPAKTLFFPLEVGLPKTISGEKVEAEILLTARTGNRQHQDKFAFRVFSNTPFPIDKSPIKVFDPNRKTLPMLQQLGYSNLLAWTGTNPTSNQTPPLLIIGREALSNGEKLPGNLETFVRNGGSAIVFEQNPEWMQKNLSFRVAPHLSRRVFAVDSNHQLIKGLDDKDLQDWTGQSTLVEAYPNTIYGGIKLSPKNSPFYGWHWGNRGAVSSVPVEKPHRSGWRSILESEFDLAYSPLMELNYGKGRLILTTLDLEDHYAVDPAAAKLARQIIEYGQTPILSPVANKVIFIGTEADAKRLDALGVIYQKSDNLLPDADLVIVGPDASVMEKDLRPYLNSGGKVFFLSRTLPLPALDVKVREVNNFPGSISLPNWPEFRGLSMSDLRSRSFYNTWLIESGGEVAADGLFSRVAVGKGVAIFSQLNPDNLQADVNTYLRFTRWRHTRAIAQILSNLGATFKADSLIFDGLDGKQEISKLTQANQGFYHPDYRSDFDLGDDPYRYYRW